MSNRAFEILKDERRRLAYLQHQRERLQQLEEQEAPPAKRAEVRTLIDCVARAHCFLTCVKRAPLVWN